MSTSVLAARTCMCFPMGMPLASSPPSPLGLSWEISCLMCATCWSNGRSHFSLSLPCCLSLSISSPGRRCSMDMVGWDLQARGPGDGLALAGEDLQAQGLGDGLLDIWTSRLADLSQHLQEDRSRGSASPAHDATLWGSSVPRASAPMRRPFSLLPLGGQRGCG